jgi:hypothetical protein
MRKRLVALILLSAPFSTATLTAGTAKEQQACEPDVRRFCGHVVINQGDFTILACLKENRAKISAACLQVLKSHNQ